MIPVSNSSVQGSRIDMRPDARERLGYVVAYEMDVDCLTVRDPRDVSTLRFETVAAFGTYEQAHWFIRYIETHGGYHLWRRITSDINAIPYKSNR